MRLKPYVNKTKISLLAVIAVLGTASAASAALVTIAIFPFNDATELASFTKVDGTACAKKLRAKKALGINLGEGATRCVFRTSVVADSSDSSPSQDLQASAGYEAKTPKNLRAKLYVSVLVRASATSGYELRVSPAKQRWMVIRDPEGPAPAATLQAGVLKAIKPGPAKLAKLRLRATATGDSVALIASINGATVYSGTESIAAGAPAGKFMEIGIGNKTGAAGTGMLGTFDDITVRIPGPF